MEKPKSWDLLILALKETINAHGPITNKLVGSAAYRIVSARLMGQMEQESPKLGRFIKQLLHYKFGSEIKRLSAADAKELKAEMAKLKEELKEVRARLKMSNDQRQKLASTLSGALKGELSVKEIMALLKTEFDYEELKSKHENMILELERSREMRGEIKARQRRANDNLHQEVMKLQDQVASLTRWQDDGGQ